MAELMKGGRPVFRGWVVLGGLVLTFGLAVGIPYYNISFFFDYFQRSFGWSRSEITFGFPLAALLTLWAGPLVVPRFSPRKLILVGTACTAMALAGFAWMKGSLVVYSLLWILYTLGYLAAGPIPHQIIVSFWFRKYRGTAMGIAYVGVGLIGSVGSLLVKPVTSAIGFRGALLVLAALVLLAWPIAIWVVRDKPEDLGWHADGERTSGLDADLGVPQSWIRLLKSRAFWLLFLGSVCSIGSIGAISTHMKFVFIDRGFKPGEPLDAAWRTASVVVLWSSVVGRLLIGYLADLLTKKYVMVATYLVIAGSIPLLVRVQPPGAPIVFALSFGIAMGADYMLIPLVAAEQFGLDSLARVMGLILPANLIAQTWFPYFVSRMRDQAGSYQTAMALVFGSALLGALAIGAMPRVGKVPEVLVEG